MTGIRVSVIDDLPQLAAAGASLRLQRLADNLGSSIGRSLLENAFYPNHVGMAAQAEMERQLDALKAQADLDRYLNIAACLGVGHHAAHAILTMQRAYFRPWAEGPPTDLELEEAEAVLHAAAPLFWRTPPPQGRQEPGGSRGSWSAPLKPWSAAVSVSGPGRAAATRRPARPCRIRRPDQADTRDCRGR